MSLKRPELKHLPVKLEIISEKYTEDLYSAGNHQQIWKFMPSGLLDSVEKSAEYIKNALYEYENETRIPFVILIADGKRYKAIGSTSFGNLRWEHKSVEIGWTWITPGYQRSAVNTICKYLLLEYAFETLGLNRVEFKTHAMNTVSINAILRLGAKQEGIFRQHMIMPDKSLRDSVYFSILDKEWSTVKEHLLKKIIC